MQEYLIESERKRSSLIFSSFFFLFFRKNSFRENSFHVWDLNQNSAFESSSPFIYFGMKNEDVLLKTGKKD